MLLYPMQFRAYLPCPCKPVKPCPARALERKLSPKSQISQAARFNPIRMISLHRFIQLTPMESYPCKNTGGCGAMLAPSDGRKRALPAGGLAVLHHVQLLASPASLHGHAQNQA